MNETVKSQVVGISVLVDLQSLGDMDADAYCARLARELEAEFPEASENVLVEHGNGGRISIVMADGSDGRQFEELVALTSNDVFNEMCAS